MVRAVVLALLGSGALLAQGKSRIEFDLATQHLAHRDAVASPVAYFGLGLGASVAYTRRVGNHDARIGFASSSLTLESRSTSGVEDVVRQQLDVSALPALTESSRWRVGPRLSVDFAYRSFLSSGANGWDFSYLFLHTGLGVSVERSARVRSSSVTWRVDVPLAGVVSRPYSDEGRIVSGEGLGWRFVTPLNLQTADVRLALTRRGNPSQRWRLVYHGYLAIYDRSAPYRALENSFGLRLTYGRLGPRR